MSSDGASLDQPLLKFEEGTLCLEGFETEQLGAIPALRRDERTQQMRAPASAYRDVVLELTNRGVAFRDEARAYESFPFQLTKPIHPRDHQTAALDAWREAKRIGVVEMPTGSGKTILAVLAIAETGRSTLVCVPTIDLMQQWHEVLSSFFRTKVGLLGAGNHQIEPITVATYDSAVLHIERVGNRFGLLIADECHHLPAPQYQNVALGSIAPLRLGLSATVERADGKEALIYELMGPLAYRARIDQMVEKVLSPYDVVNLQIALTADEKEQYDHHRKIYVDFLRRTGVDFSSPRGWMDFVMRAARMPGGKDALKSYRLQKKLAQAASGKMLELWKILLRHRDERILIFTDDNDMAYRIGREFILPVLTHQTKLKERQKILDLFRSGELQTIVTSKVLNEGVDVPEASIGVVVSGSGGVREHVQRLGRILRHSPGKRAVLYEMVSRGTNETSVNQRRRQHHAYQRSP